MLDKYAPCVPGVIQGQAHMTEDLYAQCLCPGLSKLNSEPISGRWVQLYQFFSFPKVIRKSLA